MRTEVPSTSNSLPKHTADFNGGGRNFPDANFSPIGSDPEDFCLYNLKLSVCTKQAHPREFTVDEESECPPEIPPRYHIQSVVLLTVAR
jgi:hypothetical protein